MTGYILRGYLLLLRAVVLYGTGMLERCCDSRFGRGRMQKLSQHR